jgi:hypothetical protein
MGCRQKKLLLVAFGDRAPEALLISEAKVRQKV